MVTAASGSSRRCRFSDRGLPVFEASIELRTVHRTAPPRGGIYRWFVPGFPAEQSRIPPEGRPHGGVSELQGNGQLLLRQAIDAAGGFNEDTVTDDLDLSFRLLLAGQPVGSLWDLPVREEAVLGLRVLLRPPQRGSTAAGDDAAEPEAGHPLSWALVCSNSLDKPAHGPATQRSRSEAGSCSVHPTGMLDCPSAAS